MTTARTQFRELLWQQNPAAVQLLGLCPLLAVSQTVANAIGLAAATLFVLTGSNLAIALLRHQIPQPARLPAYMLVIGGFTTIAVLVLQAFSYDLFERIALFLQIIVTNCVILARAEQVASRVGVGTAIGDGLMTGLAFAIVIITLGAVRELMGHGTLFADMNSLFGATAEDWRIDITERGMLVFALPPGAFIAFGLLLAARNATIDR